MQGMEESRQLKFWLCSINILGLTSLVKYHKIGKFFVQNQKCVCLSNILK